MRPVVWTDEARRDLSSIVGYLAQETLVVAERVGTQILEMAKR